MAGAGWSGRAKLANLLNVKKLLLAVYERQIDRILGRLHAAPVPAKTTAPRDATLERLEDLFMGRTSELAAGVATAAADRPTQAPGSPAELALEPEVPLASERAEMDTTAEVLKEIPDIQEV